MRVCLVGKDLYVVIDGCIQFKIEGNNVSIKTEYANNEYQCWRKADIEKIGVWYDALNHYEWRYLNL